MVRLAPFRARGSISRFPASAALLIVGLVSLTILTACSGQEGSSNGAGGTLQPAQPQATVTITSSGAPGTSMSSEEAGQRYLALVCPTNDLLDQLESSRQASDTLQLSPEEVKLAGQVAQSMQQQANDLMDSEYLWPSNVQQDVSDRAAAVFELAAIYQEAADSGEISFADGSLNDRVNISASRIRLQLGLSPRGDCP